MRIHLNEERKFWLAMVGGALLALALLSFWILPTRRDLKLLKDAWTPEVTKLNFLQGESDKGHIPSEVTLQDRGKYRDWLDSQADLAAQYLADRAALLDTPITGSGDISPAAFKDAYIRVVRFQKEWLENNARTMAVDTKTAFRTYRWEARTELPSPDVYQAVLRDYWARHYLFHLLSDGGATQLHMIRVGKTTRFSSRFDAMAFTLEFTIPPARIDNFVQKLLGISSATMNRPVFGLERLSIRTNPKRFSTMNLSGYILVKREKAPEGGKEETR